MLSDPLVINHGMALTATGGVASNFRRTAIGKYVSQDGAFSSDQLARLAISSRVQAAGVSTYRFKLEFDKNLNPVNGVVQQDDTISGELILKGNLRTFTAADFVNCAASCSHTSIVALPRVMGGES